MSRCVNRVMLIGNVGRDPDVLTTSTGTKVAHLSFATSRRIPKDGAVEQRTDWHRLTLWDQLAQFAEDYIRQGDQLYVEGRLEYGTFERNGVTIPRPRSSHARSCSSEVFSQKPLVLSSDRF